MFSGMLLFSGCVGSTTYMIICAERAACCERSMPSCSMVSDVRRSPAVQNDRDERESTEKRKGGKVQRFYDYSLLLTIIFLTIFGLVMIYSSSSYSAQIRFHDAGHFMKRQGYIALGSLWSC